MYYIYSSVTANELQWCQKKGTSFWEIIMERYIYLRNAQKQLKITNYGLNKSFLEFHLVYNGVCLKLLGSIL